MPRQRITAGDEFQGIAGENRIANDRVCVTMAELIESETCLHVAFKITAA